jgi:hypothetical protein
MTTQEAAKRYEAIHLLENINKEYAVYNPNDKPIETLPVIYGFNNGGSDGWYQAQLLTEDGMGIGSHICSSESYMRYDLGIYKDSRSDRHEAFKKYYPDGYRMDFVPSEDVKTHQALQEAFRLNKILSDKAKEETLKENNK